MINNAETMGFLKSGWCLTEITTDLGGNKTIYQGKCSRHDGQEDLPIWCIKKTTITTVGGVQTIVEQFADGNMDYDNVWNDRASLKYKYL